MAEKSNLITKETAKEMGRKGGIQKGINAKKRKSMQDMLGAVLTRKITDFNTIQEMKAWGFKPSEMNNQGLILFAMMKAAVENENVKATELLVKILGEVPVSDAETNLFLNDANTHNETLLALKERNVDGVDDE